MTNKFHAGRLLSLISLLALFAFGTAAQASNSCESFLDGAAVDVTAHYENMFKTKFEDAYAYGWKTDFAKELSSLFSDRSGGARKIRLLKELGFRFEGDKIIPPTFQELLDAYIAQLNKMKVPENERILPAVVFFRIDMKRRSMEYRLVTPGIDPWPTEPGFQRLSSNTQFNLPGPVVLEALKRGRFPVMEVSHDVFHLIGYLNAPNFMRSLTRAIAKLDVPARPGIGMRLNYLNEVLSLGNPRLKKQIETRLTRINIVETENLAFNEVKAEFDRMSENDLLKYAKTLAETYPTLLHDYGGGVNRSSEKKRYAALLGGATVLSLFPPFTHDRGLDVFWRNSPSSWDRTLRELTELAEKSDPDLATFLGKSNAYLLKDPQFKMAYFQTVDVDQTTPTEHLVALMPTARAQILNLIRLHSARWNISCGGACMT